MYSLLIREKVISFLKKWGVAVFFGLFFLLGVVIFRDYGMYWDDVSERIHGKLVFDYLFHYDNHLLFSVSKYHGPFFEFTFVLLEKALRLTDSRAIYLARHFFVFLVFYAGTIFFYFLGKKLFLNRKAALGGVLILILSPRIFGHAFYNTKDIPALAAGIAGFFTLINYLDGKDIKSAFWHAFACAVFTASRLTGVFLVFLTMIFAVSGIFAVRDKRDISGSLLSLGFYIVSFFVFLVCCWPILLTGMVYHLTMAFAEMSHVTWLETFLYCGRYLREVSIWHYVPVWILISTPLTYIFYFFSGLGFGLFNFFKGTLLPREKRNFLIVFSWFFLPLVTVILLHSRLYDSWRHMYFIYPAIVLIAIFGAKNIFYFLCVRNKVFFYLIAGVTIFSVGGVVLFMVRNHPLEELYFNCFAGRDLTEAKARFDFDYWGLSYRKGLEYLLAVDSRTDIKICFANQAGERTVLILPETLRKRVVTVKTIGQADYYLTNFREYKESYPYRGFKYPVDKVYSVRVDGAEAMAVYRL